MTALHLVFFFDFSTNSIPQNTRVYSTGLGHLVSESRETPSISKDLVKTIWIGNIVVYLMCKPNLYQPRRVGGFCGIRQNETTNNKASINLVKYSWDFVAGSLYWRWFKTSWKQLLTHLKTMILVVRSNH